MNIYIVNGGIGKHIMFSSIIEKLAATEKIIIVSSYPELFKFHPKVERSSTFYEPGFYDQYIKDTDNNIIYHEPYFSNYVRGKTHFIRELANLHGVDYTDDTPDIFIDDFAVEEAERFIKNFPEFIITQFSGGQSPINFDRNRPFINTGQIKDYPGNLAQELVDKIKEKYPTMVILNYALPNEATYNLTGCIQIEAPFLFYVCLLKYCKSFISIDSSLQHFAANRYNIKKGVVLWGTTSPICLGYNKNINLSNKKEKEHTMRPLCSSVGDIFNKDGSPWKPDDIECMNINPSLILDSLNQCIAFNNDIDIDLTNIIKNESIIEVNEKTRYMLISVEKQINELSKKYQTIIDTYVASQNKEGRYNISKDGKKLFKV